MKRPIEYRVNKLSKNVFVVEIVWGLLDTSKLKGPTSWSTYAEAVKAAKEHAASVCGWSSPIIIRGA